MAYRRRDVEKWEAAQRDGPVRVTGEWWDRPSMPGAPRTLSTDLVGIREAMWFLRRSRFEVLSYAIAGDLELVGHRADMFRAPDLRAMRDRARPRENGSDAVRLKRRKAGSGSNGARFTNTD